MRYWLANGTVFTAVSKKGVKKDILVEDGKIVKIGKADKSCKIIDVKGKNIYPGLVEAHCHLGLHGFAVRYEGADYNEYAEPVTPELEAIDGFNPLDPSVALALRGGVTCVGTGPGSSNVLGGTFIAVKTAGNCVDEMVVKRKAAMKCAFGENPKMCYQSKGITSRMTTACKLRDALFKARDYMRKLDAAGDDASKRPDFNMRHEALLPVLRGEIPLKAHAHRADDILTAIRIAKEFGVKLTLEHCTEGHLIVDQLVKANLPLAVGPTFTYASKPELRQKSFETAGILDKAGCQVSIITDSAVIPQEQLSLCAALAVKAGMDEFSALQAITIRPARHLGIDARVGSIEVGKDADFVVCDRSILDTQNKIEMVFVNGERVV